LAALRAGLRPSGSRESPLCTVPEPFSCTESSIGARKKRDVGRSGRAKCQSARQQPPRLARRSRGGVRGLTQSVLRATSAGRPDPRSALVAFFSCPGEPRSSSTGALRATRRLRTTWLEARSGCPWPRWRRRSCRSGCKSGRLWRTPRCPSAPPRGALRA
jgi:hypothetical protein